MLDIRELLGKERYSTEDLRRIVEILRSPGGCPWDAKQTHASIRKNFIEECYEAVEAIDKGDDALLCEELGDVLLQVGLHTQIASERGAFDWDSVTDGICRKLIERHPHVFGDVEVTGVENVLSNWDAIKRASKGQGSTARAMGDVPRQLPALMRAQKLQSKAAKAGFDWPAIDGALERLEEEIQELRASIAAGDEGCCRDELGDVLFSAVNVSRFLPGCDAEEALTASSDKFMARFAFVEQLAAEQGVDMKSAPLEELDKLWEIAKQQEK
ncbi:MAG: nucleoside triphosphate pyrophosphohydrolase [Firmicutes bacterium]|nr:nucleoside triphosphate pyrophosphohydrolase [Bacillota bacterium]